MYKQCAGKVVFFVVLIVIAAYGISGCTFEYRPSYKPVALAVATVRVPGSLPVFVAKEEGFFETYGLNVTLTNHPVGRQVVDDIAAGKADVGTAADLAVTLGIMEGKKLLIPASVCIADAGNAIVGRRDRGIVDASNLAGKKVGVTKGTTADYFLDVFLLLHRVPGNRVKKIYMPQDRLVAALQSGSVDAVSCWNPITTEAAQAAGKDAAILQARDFFDTFYLLAANEDFVKKNPEVLKRLLLALRDAADFIADHPDRAVAILRQYTGDKRETPTEGYHYDLTLEQSLIINLWNTLNWATETGYTSRGNINFMATLYFDPLQQIDPDLVTVLK